MLDLVANEMEAPPDGVDWSWRIYPSTRTFPFVEMEYTLPLAETFSVSVRWWFLRARVT